MIVHSFVERRMAQIPACGATLTLKIAKVEYAVSTIRFDGRIYTRVTRGPVVAHYEGDLDTHQAASLLHKRR